MTDSEAKFVCPVCQHTKFERINVRDGEDGHLYWRPLKSIRKRSFSSGLMGLGGYSQTSAHTCMECRYILHFAD